MNFENSYIKNLSEKFYQKINPHQFANPRLAYFNEDLADDLGIKNLSKKELSEIFSGKKILPTSTPIALAYAGHQFGHFVWQLGDGRAILLGEIIAKNKTRYDIQLKGSGKTKFSRRGDGFATIGAMVREYIMSEAMYALKIPTTRSLAIIATNEPVFREEIFPGAILTRVALSHIRVGTFEYFAAQKDYEAVKELANYAINRHFENSKNSYVNFFAEVVERQASLIAKWMAVGFIHGVMNTDNMAISGETIDYGPCAFLDEYDAKKVFSSIDHNGRYAFANQSNIAKWNLLSLGQCLLQLFDADESKAIAILGEELEKFDRKFHDFYLSEMAKKLGFFEVKNLDFSLLEDLLNLMQKYQANYHITFRKLSNALDKNQDLTALQAIFNNSQEFDLWLKKWHHDLQKQGQDFAQVITLMNQTNPFVIAQNHQVEIAIKSAEENNDFSKMANLVKALKNPFVESEENQKYALAPSEEERICKTFCGT